MSGRVSNAPDGAGVSAPVSAVAEEVAALDGAGMLLQAASSLIGVTRRSLEDWPADAPITEPAAGMQFATLAALAARNGITLIALTDGSYLLCKWGLSRAVPDLCVVASLLRRTGVSV